MNLKIHPLETLVQNLDPEAQPGLTGFSANGLMGVSASGLMGVSANGLMGI